MAGVNVKQVDNIAAAVKRAKNDIEKFPNVTIVADNDKRNAFNLVKKDITQNETPFWLHENDLPNYIKDKLQNAFEFDKHRYFLSIYDYFQWLKEAIGVEDLVEYWDRINYLTIKSREIEDYRSGIYYKEKEIPLAYSCVSFEFWLTLHFQKNTTPFIWVDKGKDKSIDVFTFLQTICPDYDKGAEKKCNAYTCLFEDYTKKVHTKEDDWLIIYRIIQACQNEKWLQNQMQPVLERQNGKWFEVNPYLKGFDKLMSDLLNLKRCKIEFQHSDLDVKFTFTQPNTVEMFIRSSDAFKIEQKHKNCFIIKSKDREFLPIFENCSFPNDNPTLILTYNISGINEDEILVLVFKDPRERSRSRQLMILLEN